MELDYLKTHFIGETVQITCKLMDNEGRQKVILGVLVYCDLENYYLGDDPTHPYMFIAREDVELVEIKTDEEVMEAIFEHESNDGGVTH